MKLSLFLLCVTLLGLPGGRAFAAYSETWDYERLFAEADLVAIVEPTRTDRAPELDRPYPKLSFLGLQTTFRVVHPLKGQVARREGSQIKLLHLKYGPDVKVIVNGARFVSFATGPQEIEARRRKPKRDRSLSGWSVESPQWLVFLKRRADGRYEPVSGQTQPTDSFRELGPPALYQTP